MNLTRIVSDGLAVLQAKPELSLISSLFAIYALVGGGIPEISAQYDWALRIGIVVALIGVFVWAGYRIEHNHLPGADQSNVFYPFFSGLTDEKRRALLVPRDHVAADLLSIATQNPNRHLVVAGDSGAGKSTLVAEFLLPSVPSSFVIAEYDRVTVGELLSHLLPDRLITNPRDKAERDLLMRRLLSPGYENHASDTELRLTQLLEKIWSDKILAVLDQSERLAVALTSNNEDTRAIDRDALGLILRIARKSNRIHTIMLIRSEDVVSAIGAIGHLEKLPPGADSATVLRFFLYPGIDIGEDDGAFVDVTSRFSRTSIDIEPALMLRRVTSTTNNSANAFSLELIGYIGDAFYHSDRTIRKEYQSSQIDIGIVIDRLWYYLLSEYSPLREKDEESLLFMIVYTVSSVDEAIGAPVSSDEIARITSLPHASVSHAAAYLKRKGILVAVEDGRGSAKMRVVHDIVRDHFLNGTFPRVRNAYKDAVRYQIEHSANLVQLPPAPEYSWFLEHFATPSRWNLPFIIIVSMMAICGMRLAVPFYLLDYYESYAAIFGVPNDILITAGIGSAEYFPRMVAQFAWVTFMYNFNYNYFDKITHGRAPIAGHMARWSAPLGAIFGGMTIYTPDLFILPIIVGGTMLSFAYFGARGSGAMTGLAGSLAGELGWKTLVNMVLSLGFTVILYILYRHSNIEWAGLVAATFFAIGFVYFYYLMKPRQCSPQGWGELFVSGRVPAVS